MVPQAVLSQRRDVQALDRDFYALVITVQMQVFMSFCAEKKSTLQAMNPAVRWGIRFCKNDQEKVDELPWKLKHSICHWHAAIDYLEETARISISMNKNSSLSLPKMQEMEGVTQRQGQVDPANILSH